MYLILLTLCVALILAIYWLVSLRRTHRRTRLYRVVHPSMDDDLSHIGISAVVSGVDSVECVESLLDVESLRYEVVLIIDTERQGALFKSLLRQFGLVRVAYTNPEGLAVESSVRGLYRSSKRLFRRLVLVDCSIGDAQDAYKIGAGVALYNYILLLTPDLRLHRDAIDRLLSELAQPREHSVELVSTAVGAQIHLIARERLLKCGDGDGLPLCGVRRRNRLLIWEELAEAVENKFCN